MSGVKAHPCETRRTGLSARYPEQGRACFGHEGGADSSSTARGRKHPYHARGCRRGGQAGDALFGRQGFGGDAASGAQGLLPIAAAVPAAPCRYHMEVPGDRSEEHTSELPSLMRISYAVFCLKTKQNIY